MEEQENGLVEIRCRMKTEQVALLEKILLVSDFQDFEQLENDIFEFGRTVSTKDYLGRKIFVCMVSFLRLSWGWNRQAY